MATNTTNYGWTKPDYEDDADIAVLNETFDDIDEQVKTNENNISTLTLHGSKSNDVDNVAVNEFAMYGSTAPNLPTDAYTIVRTSIYSATAALQEAFVTSTGDAYVRTKAGGVWGTWKKMTP